MYILEEKMLAQFIVLDVRLTYSTVSMASTDLLFKTVGRHKANLMMSMETSKRFNLSLIDNLYADVILRQEFQALPQKIEILYEGNRPSPKLC